jgi:sec-independent protein translocase protein TatA
MDFLGIGGGEIILILIIALLIWGPNRIVEIGRTLGKTVHAFRKATSDITVRMEKELQDQKEEQKKAQIENIQTDKVPPAGKST